MEINEGFIAPRLPAALCRRARKLFMLLHNVYPLRLCQSFVVLHMDRTVQCDTRKYDKEKNVESKLEKELNNSEKISI